MITLLLWGCGRDAGPPIAPAAEVWVEARVVAAGEPAVLHAPAASVMPAVEGLTFAQTAVTDDGRATWEVRGTSGSYIVPVPGTSGAPNSVQV